MITREEIREGVAKGIYTDWNKDEEFSWEKLPDHRKQPYLDWVDMYVIQFMASKGCVIKVEGWLPTRNGMVCTIESLIEVKND